MAAKLTASELRVWEMVYATAFVTTRQPGYGYDFDHASSCAHIASQAVERLRELSRHLNKRKGG